MFGLKIVHQRELALYTATILELRKEKDALSRIVEMERRRADAAVNALLIKTQKIAITPSPVPLNEDQEEAVKQSMLDLFNDAEQLNENEILEKIQHERS